MKTKPWASIPATVIVAVILLMAFTFKGCAVFTRPEPPEPIMDERTRETLEKVSSLNAAVTSFKGLGTIFVENEQQNLRSRLAWMGQVPDKIRFQILGPGGQPLLAMSSDGSVFYFLEYGGEGRFMKRSGRRVSLEQVIGIPIEIEEIVCLLAGRIPLRDFEAAQLAGQENELKRLVLSRGRNDSPVEVIYLHPDSGQPAGVDFFDTAGKRQQYRVRLSSPFNVDGYDIPRTIELEADNGSSAVITMERCWLNETVTREQFILTPPTD